VTSPFEHVTRLPEETPAGRRPADLRIVSVFLFALLVLLAGYMFLGRGFAHLGRSPIFVGEIVLIVGLLATGVAIVRLRPHLRLSLVAALLLGFMGLGVVRTVPYLGVFGVDALRDAVLWGYAAFAVMVYVLADRVIVLGALRVYGWVVPVFAFWLPISYSVFVVLSANIQPDELGSNVPIVFFKSGDMAVHIVGALGFLVLGAGANTSVRTFAWRSVITVPVLWTILVVGATNRGGLVTVAAGVVVIAALAVLLKRSRNWRPVLATSAVLALSVGTAGIFSQLTTGETASRSEASPVASGFATASPPGTSPQPATTTCEAAPASRSLIANPGFELGTPNNGHIEAWTTWAGLYSIVEGGAYRGARYASIENTGEPWKANITSTEFPFEAGYDLSVSLWAKAIDGRPVIATYVHWLDGSGTEISAPFMTELATDGRGTWQESTGVLTAPPGTTHATVQLFETAGHATIGLDEVIVKSATTTCEAAPASRSLIANPGFELGTPNNGHIEAWTTWAGLYSIVEGGAYRGARYASIENTGEPWKANITSTEFPFEAGYDLSVSLWAKAIDGRPVIATYVHWLDGSGTEISAPFMTELATDGRGTWQESTGVLTAPPGTTHATVQLFETAGHATIGLDEVIVKSGHFEVSGPAPEGRSNTIDQIIANIVSIFSTTSDDRLEGSKEFRLRWWGSIVNYTVFGDYFWTGKGFGVNLADDDGFQANADGSLRSPHNSHMTALARMGVPGFVLWLVLQGAFGIGLLRSVLAHRRAGMTSVALVGAWILVYWVAMMVNTSFDPYLEGPQGGIWFWSLFGLGMVVMRLSPRSLEG
jgi:Carbohydrate binding domain